MRIERVGHSASPPLGVVFGAALAVAGLVAAVWLRVGLPRPGCPFRAATGFPCPTCGSTRLVEALLAGDLLGAVGSNPLVFVTLAVVGGWSAASAARWAFGLQSLRVSLGDHERRLLRLLAVASFVAGWAYLIWRGV